MSTSIENVPPGSTVETLDVLLSTLDVDRDRPLEQLTGHRVLDVYQDAARMHDRDGWFMVCVEDEEGERKWVQAPPQQLETIDRADASRAAFDLPVAPTRHWVMPADLRPGDRIRHGESRVEGTVVSITREPDVDAEWFDVPGDKVVIETVDGDRGTLTLNDYSRVEREGLLPGSEVRNLRQVLPGTTVRLAEAFEPVREGNFPAPDHMLNGTVKDIRPADPGYTNMLVYMVSAESEGWLKVPTSQGVGIIETAPSPVPPAPWDAGTMGSVTGPLAATLADVEAGAVVGGLRVYPIESVAALREDQAWVLNSALIQDVKPLGVEVDGKDMMLLSIHDQNRESLVIAERDGALTVEFNLPARAKSSSVRLEHVSHKELLMGAYNTPILAQGLNQHGEAAAFYGNLMEIQPEGAGFTLLPSMGRITPGSQWLTSVQEGSLWQFKDSAQHSLVVPAKYLKPGHTIVNDDGARAVVIANNDADLGGTRDIVVKVEGMGVNAVIEVPDGKLFCVDEQTATLTPEAIDYETSLATELHHMPLDYEEAFVKITGTEDVYTPGLG